MKKYYFPDDSGNAGGTSLPTDTHVRHRENLPGKDADLLHVAQMADAQWAATSLFTLVWKTEAQFREDVQKFADDLQHRDTEGGKRSQQTKDVDNLDVQIEDALPYVKSYISEKFGPPNATAHYNEFGIEHRHSAWDLPADRQNRKSALHMMVAAMGANGFDTKQYGTAWWADIETKYIAAVAASSFGAGNVSNDVSSLVLLRSVLRHVLHSILLMLEANYPDTFAQVRRDWGFQKETY